MEDTRSVAGWLGGQELLTGNTLMVDEVVSTIGSIQAFGLLRAAQFFTLHKLNLAVVCPIENNHLKEMLECPFFLLPAATPLW